MTDHLGSTAALTDSSGAITYSTSYDSFGNAISNQATGSAASGAGKAAPNIATTYRYTGREYGVDTGLYYYRNRWYDPEVGKFISEDPIGFAGGDINLYGYVGNNPLSFVDPSGNYACRRGRSQRGRQRQDPKKANLSLEDTIRYAAAVTKILGLLKNPNSDCYKFLNSLGFNPNRIVENLMNSIPYDGTRSTNDAGYEFGVTGETVKDRYFYGDQSDAVAATSRDGKSIYYNRAALNVQTIIHENIHATNMSPSGERWNIYDPDHPDADPMLGIRPGGLYHILDPEIQKAMGYRHTLLEFKKYR